MAKRRTGRRSYRRRRPTRSFKRKYKRGYKKSGNNKIYYFTRYLDGTSAFAQPVQVSNITPAFREWQFHLNDVVNYQEFTALYDMYKINAVKVYFYPQQTQSTSLSTFNNADAAARFYSVIDRNDGNTLTQVNDAREYKSCKWTTLFRPHIRYIHKPKIVDRGDTYTPGNPWIKTTSPDQNYYGLKIAVEPTQAAVATIMTFRVEIKYYLAFKNVK